MSNKTRFKADVHYRHEALVSCVSFEHTRWYKSEDGEMVSLLKVDSRSWSKDGLERPVSCSLNIWGVTPEELRELIGALVDAAYALEEHIAQVGLGGAS